MQNLEWLALSRTAVTDAGMVHLKSLSRLTALHVEESGLSAAGIAELKQNLPRLQINAKGREADR
jgi:hypothetical protein